MCSEPRTAAPAPIMHATVQDAPYEGELIPLEPVDSVAITTICDNTVDILMLDEGPAHRLLGRPGEPQPSPRRLSKKARWWTLPALNTASPRTWR